MGKCINCGKELLEEQQEGLFVAADRRCGKSRMLFYYHIRKACCSNKCFDVVVKKIQEVFDE